MSAFAGIAAVLAIGAIGMLVWPAASTACCTCSS